MNVVCLVVCSGLLMRRVLLTSGSSNSERETCDVSWCCNMLTHTATLLLLFTSHHARNIENDQRSGRDLVLENMVMRTTKFKPQDNSAPSPLVGGGILERKIIVARNGTERTHSEDREMECCGHVMVGGDQFGGVHGVHSYVSGVYKKIGVCDGRSLYQQETNTEIFMYYVCGRWFIGDALVAKISNSALSFYH